MSAWTPTYSREQRAAVEHAYCVLRLRPARVISERAAAGQLSPSEETDPLPAFEIPESTARDIGKRAERRRAGDTVGELGALPPRDGAERLRRRLVDAIDRDLVRIELAQKAGKALDAEHARKLARALRELGSLPGPNDLRLPPAAGERDATGAQVPALGASILRAADRNATAPATDSAPAQESADGEHNAPRINAGDSSSTSSQEATAPGGTPERGEDGALSADVVLVA